MIVVLSLPPVAGYVWRGFVFGDWGWGVAGLIICAGFTLSVWHGLLTRTTNCNSSVYHRYERPVRYGLAIIVWFAGWTCLSQPDRSQSPSLARAAELEL